MTLSLNENRAVVAFAREHYCRISPIVVHTLTDKNMGDKTLVSTTENIFSSAFTCIIVYVTLTSCSLIFQMLSSGFRRQCNLPPSACVYLSRFIVLVKSKWSEDEKGRLVMEKATWKDFVRQAGCRVGDAVMFCITPFSHSDGYHMKFSVL